MARHFLKLSDLTRDTLIEGKQPLPRKSGGKTKALVPIEMIEKKILLIRGQKVMLSMHLAELYGVEPRVLVQAVKRSIARFPEDFMFQLSKGEFDNLKSQTVTSSWGGLRRATPYAFTEQGVAMLSSVLNGERAINVNIEIMRAFVKLRQMLASNAGFGNIVRIFAIVFGSMQTARQR